MDQEREIRSALAQKGIDHSEAVVIYDEAESGTKTFRDEFVRLQQMVSAGEVSILAVDDQSRLTRADNAFAFITDLVFAGGRFVSTSEGLDTDQPGWRAALVLFFNCGLDTGTIWKANSSHQPILWRHVTWQQVSPNTQTRERSRWGWILYRRAKTGKMFVRPMNRVVHAHVWSLQHNDCDPESPVLTGGGSRPNLRFRQLCSIAGLEPRLNMESGAEEPWQLKDLRKTCATYFEEHIPGSSVEILGHYARGITYRHYAHRDPLAAKAIMTIPQPTAFTGLAKGITDMCPCCRRPFSAAE